MMMPELNFRICHGTTRTVILVGRYAFKFPSCVEWRLFLHGLLANMQESQFSKTGWEKLCPVVFAVWGGLLVVMRRAEPLPREAFFSLDFEKWRDLGNGGIVPSENKLDSFGMLDGRIVAVDYGS